MSNDEISEEDKALFRQAMRSVKPLRSTNKTLPRQDSPKSAIRNSREKTEIHAMQLPIYLSDSYREELSADSIISYSAHVIPAKRMRELKSGLIPRQARLDLHGLNPDKAKDSLVHFISEAQRKNQRSLLIIHGKGGLHGETPILKNLVNYWLQQLPEILAFHSALAKDGGAGALYVLLRKTLS